ncbi:amidohydrolase family protein [Allorhizocola rhizosphaerae]|uniref:amidohydrolase family protein n=1 Tax=Allorhizocola rhizosphaerae TaxID=1872709 RepID=UPI0013C37A8C|nr:amidohydrolase family protein [Allorhizocola rhizosphaerae]
MTVIEGGRVTVTDAHRLLGPVPTDDVPSATVAGLLAELDRLAIDTAYVTHSYALFGDPAEANDALFAAVAGVQRLRPVPVVIPAIGGAAVPSTVGDLDTLPARGVAMVRLAPSRHRFDLTGPVAARWLDRLATLGLAVAVDLEDTTPAALRTVASAHPSLPLLVLGGGFRRLRELGELLDVAPSVRLETGSLNTSGAVEWIAARWGAHRLVFGTGAPLLDDAGPRFQLDQLNLSASDRARIASGSLAAMVASPSTPDDPPPPWTARPPGPVLDAHGHIGGWHDFFIPDSTAAGLVATAERAGVTAIGVSHLLAVGADPAEGNRRALEAAREHPGRLGVWLVANPQRPSQVDALREQLAQPHVWGIKLHPDVHQCALDDPAYAPVFELAAEHRAPVLAHGQTGSPWSDPVLFAEVGRRHAEVPLLMGHAGLWAHGFARAARLVADVPNVCLETCGSRMTAGWITRLVKLAGADRVIYGSDACFLDLRHGLGRVMGARLTEPDRAAVLGGNLARLLHIGGKA